MMETLKNKIINNWPQIAVGMMMLIASLLTIGLLVKVGNSNKEIAKLKTQINKVQKSTGPVGPAGVQGPEGLKGDKGESFGEWLKRVNSKIELKRFNIDKKTGEKTLHGRQSVASWLKRLNMEKAELETFLKLTNFKFYKFEGAIYLLDSVKNRLNIKTNKMQGLK